MRSNDDSESGRGRTTRPNGSKTGAPLTIRESHKRDGRLTTPSADCSAERTTEPSAVSSNIADDPSAYDDLIGAATDHTPKKLRVVKFPSGARDLHYESKRQVAPTATDLKRFTEKVLRLPARKRGCWLWIGTKTKDGYGRFYIGKREFLAHRIAVQWNEGRLIPDGMEVDHTCKVRACVNLAHLKVVDHAQNMRATRRVANHGSATTALRRRGTSADEASSDVMISPLIGLEIAWDKAFRKSFPTSARPRWDARQKKQAERILRAIREIGVEPDAFAMNLFRFWDQFTSFACVEYGGSEDAPRRPTLDHLTARNHLEACMAWYTEQSVKARREAQLREQEEHEAHYAEEYLEQMERELGIVF